MTADIAEVARRRHEMHQSHPSHRPLSKNYELVGLRGEEAWCEMFGGVVDTTERPGGDGGVDNRVTLATEFRVDVKTSRRPIGLLVVEGKVRPWTIYVLAGYDEARDRAELLGWEWGTAVLRAPVVDVGTGLRTHKIPREQLRPISELKARHIIMRG